MSHFTFYLGCEEWQDVREHISQEEATKVQESWKLDHYTMGLYTATYGYIEDETTGRKSIFLE